MWDFLYRALDYLLLWPARRQAEADAKRKAEVEASDRAIREELEAAERRRKAQHEN
jgi:hypothetical protein